MFKNIVVYLVLISSLQLYIQSVDAQDTKIVKNVILMIPDGTSTSVLSLARWYKYGQSPSDTCSLNIDKYICGLVRTHSSDAPIGDSAPTGSTYATGYLSHTGFVATYPPTAGKERDLVKIDPSRAYQPLFTILEASKLLQKSTGLVVTCQFPNATPADFSAHTPYRDKYDLIAKQMVYNNIDVMFGGGTQYLEGKTRNDSVDLVAVLKERKYKYITDYKSFKSLKPIESRVWGLFTSDYLPYDLDRNPDSIPSLEEMTDKAIKILSQNKNGFFLMVEGSKVDWAAHNNDPVGVATEFLAFDRAVKVVMDFAKIDGNTAVVICPDHGNSAISIGNNRSSLGYDTLSISSIVKPLINRKLTAEGLAIKLKEHSVQEIQQIVKKYTDISLMPFELEVIKREFNESLISLTRAIAKIYTFNSYIGFTSTGHTAEDVLLANYHPHGYNLSGVIRNVQINKYITEVLGIHSLDSLTEKYYSPDSIALKDYNRQIVLYKTDYATLIIRKNNRAKKRAEIQSATDFMTIFEGNRIVKQIQLESIAVFIPKNEHMKQRFFVPSNIQKTLMTELNE